jgi:hypothetical protein
MLEINVKTIDGQNRSYSVPDDVNTIHSNDQSN